MATKTVQEERTRDKNVVSTNVWRRNTIVPTVARTFPSVTCARVTKGTNYHVTTGRVWISTNVKSLGVVLTIVSIIKDPTHVLVMRDSH
jgi:hypothetical protein